MERHIVLVIAALLAAVHAGPVQRASSTSCARTCTESNKIAYEPGKTYQYRYDSEISTQVKGASENRAAVHFTAIVDMDVVSKCDMVMRLSDVTLKEFSPADDEMVDISEDFKRYLEEFPVKISYQDGTIADVCATTDDPTWVLNVKRGILSMFQNTMDDLSTNQTVTETDVTGVCDTEYYVREPGWYTNSVGKSKNLAGCTERAGYNTAIQSIPYTAQSEIQSLPVVNSDHHCVHDMDKASGILKLVKCNEQHRFRPFSSSDSGAMAETAQTLTYIQTTSSISKPVTTDRRLSLKFEHVNDPSAGQKTKKEITQKLTEICARTQSGVRENTPKLFSDLVFMMRSAEADVLADLYKMVTKGVICPDNKVRVSKFFLDALPMVGTSASLDIMTDLITREAVTGIEADMWITSLAFIKNPNQEMLKAVKPLINLKNKEEKTLLSVGTLVHSYCSYHGDCEKNAFVRAIISALKNKVAKGCKVNDANFKSTLMALRSLGNAGYAQSAAPVLDLCMKIPSNPIEIRLSAIEAYRRMPCDIERRGAIKIYQDEQEDSEIRIAAYRVMMECPTPEILDIVRRTLASEEVNQVGSYVWSHLTNLMETSDRHKQHIRAILENEKFKKEFDLDKRKFSRNYEGSVFLDKINTGAKAEADMIWSTKSFLPRSGMVNLTVDLFGHSVNLLEVGGRAEGIEYILESFFGPNGYFSDMTNPKSPETALKNVKQKKLDIVSKRFDASRMENLRASMYFRVFGNELRYMNMRSLDDLLAGPSFNILDMLIQLAKDNDYTYSYSTMFLDTSVIIPTSVGFPLNLTVNGTATMDLKLKGKMDLRAPPSVDIKGLIQPSAAIDISSMMSVDAFVTRAGVKMVSSLNTRTALQGTFHVAESGALTAEWEMPEPKMEIINVKSSFFTVHRDSEREQKMLNGNRQEMEYCTPDKLASITGLELCAQLSYPNASGISGAPYFPLTGPVSAGIYLYNRDTHNVYQISAKSIHTRTNNLIHLKFNTPNSRVDRLVSVDFDLNKKTQTLDMSLASPWQSASAEAVLTTKKDVNGLTGKMQISGMGAYTFSAKMVRDRVGNAYRYTPTLLVTAPHINPLNMRGMLKYNGMRQVDIEYDMDGFTAQPVSASMTIFNKPVLQGVKGSLSFQKDRTYSFDVNLSQKATKKKVTYKPLISVRVPEAEVLAFGGTVVHVYDKNVIVNLILDKVVQKKVVLKGNIAKIARRRRTLYRTKMSFISKPMDLALNMKLVNKKFRTIATDIDFTYVIRKVARNNIKLVSKITNLSSSSLTKGKAAVNFAVKRNPELNWKMLGNVFHKKQHTDFDIDLRYGNNYKDENRHLTMNFELNRQIKSLMEASANIQSRVRFPGQGINVFVKGNHKHDDRSLDSSLQLRLGKLLPIETSLRINDDTNKFLKVSGEYRLSFPGRDIILNETITQINDKKFLNAFNLQLKKGKKTALMTTVTYPGESQVGVVSDIHIYGYKPVQITGDLNLDPTNFKSAVSYKKDSKKFAASVASKTRFYDEGQSSQLQVDLLHPERQIWLYIGLNNMNNILGMETGFKWNAGRNDSEVVNVSAWMEPPSVSKFNGSITVNYPFRTLVLNVHQLLGAKYSAHADFEWETGKKITADAILGVKKETVIGTAEMTTPFQKLPKLRINLSHKDDREEYLTSMDVIWQETVGFVFNLKKPASLKTLVASIATSSSFKVLRRMKFEVNHKLSSSLASSAKLGWNGRSVQTTITLQNKTTGKKQAFRGVLDLKTSFQYIKKGKLDISHDNNGQKFNTVIKVVRNRQVYTVNNMITHKQSKKSFDNSGKLTYFSRNMNADMAWSHIYSASKYFKSTTNSSWGKKKKNNKDSMSLQINANMDKNFAGSVQLQTPFKQARDISMEANWETDKDMLDSKLKLSRNGANLGSAKMNYLSESHAGIAIEIPSLEVNSRIEANTSEEKRKLFGNLNIHLTNNVFLYVNAKQTFDGMDPGHLARTSLIISLPKRKPILYTYSIMISKNLTTIARLEYGDNKVIEMRREYKVQHDKKEYGFYASLTTPFSSLPKMHGAIDFYGDFDSFKSDAFIEILPSLNKTSVTVSWQGVKEDGFNCSVRLDTPLEKYPYIQTDILMKMKDGWVSGGDIAVEYLPRQIMKLQFQSIFKPHVDMALTFTAPFTKLNLFHKTDRQSFKCSGAFGLESNKEYGLDIDFKHEKSIESTLTLSVPGKRPVTVYISHIPSTQGFKSHVEVLHNKKNKLFYDIELKNSSKFDLSTSGSLKSEYISDDEYVAALSLQGRPMNFNSHAEFYRSKQQRSSLDIAFDITKDIEGDFFIKSPMIKNIKVSFNHHMDETLMNSKAALIRGGKKIIHVTSTINMDKNIDGDINIKSTFSKGIKLSVRIDGNLKNFNLYSEGSVGDKKAEIEMSSQFEKKITHQAVTLKMTGMNDTSATFRRDGGLKDFKSYAEVIIDQQQHKIDATFNGIQDIDGRISVSSPLVQPLSMAIKIDRELDSLRSHGEVNIGSEKSEIDMNYRTTPKFEGSFVLSSPYVTNIRVGVDHYGKLPNIISNGQLVIDNQDSFDVRLTVSQATELSGSVIVTTPYTNFEKLKAAFSHAGTLESFRSHADYSIGSNKTELEVSFNSLEQYNGHVFVKSYLTPDFSASFDHSGSAKAFRTHAEYIIAGEKSEMDFIADLTDKIDTSLDVRRPSQSDISAAFILSGSPSKFITSSSLTEGGDTWKGEATFDMTDGLQGTVGLKPATGYDLDRVQITFDHQFDNNELKSHVELTIGDSKSVGDIQFSLSNVSSTAHVVLKSPYITDIETNFEYRGQPQDFVAHVDLTIGEEKSIGNINLIATKDSVVSSITMNSPYIDDVSINLNHDGPMKRFSTHADITIGTKRSDMDVTYQSTKKSVTLSGTAKHPDMENVIVNFGHSGKRSNFATHGDITFGGKTREADVKFSSKNGISGSVTILSPAFDLKAEHSQNSGIIVSKLELRNNTDKYSVEAQLSTEKKFEASMKLTSPFADYEQMSLIYTHNGTPTNFQCHSELSIGQTNSVSDIVVNVEDISNMAMKGTLSVNTDDYVVETSFKNDKNIEASFTATSPIEGYESISAVYTHTGEPSDFQCNLLVSTTQNRHTANLRLNVADLSNIDGNFDLSSAVLPQINAKLLHSVTSTKYHSNAEITIDVDRTYGFTSTFSNSSGLEGDIEINTHIQGYHIIKLSGQYQPISHGLESSLSFILGNDQSDIDIHFISSPRLQGSLDVKSKYLPNVFAAFDASLSSENFNGNSEIKINGEKKGSASVLFDVTNANKIVYKASVETPHENFTRVSMDFSANIEDDSADATFVLTNSNNNIIDAAAKYSNSDSIVTEISLRSTYIHPLSASFGVSGAWDNFKADASLTHNENKLIATGAEFKLATAPVSSSGSFSFNEMSVSYNFDNTSGNIKASADINLSDNHWHVDTSYSNKAVTEAQINLELPNVEPIHAMLSHNLRQYKCITHAELEISNSNKYEFDMNLKWRRVLQGDFSIKTPIDSIKTLEAKIRSEGKFPNIESSTTLKCEDQEIIFKTNLKHGKKMTAGGISLSSPFSGYENLEVTFYKKGTLASLGVGGQVTYAVGENIESSLEYVLGEDTLRSHFRLMSKFTDEIVVSFNHSGNLMNHENSAEISMGADNRIRTDSEMKSGTNYLHYSSTTKSTISGEDITEIIEFKHTGTLKNFRTEALAQMNEKKIVFDSYFQMKPIINGKASLVTPFENFKESMISFSHSESGKGFRSDGEIRYAPAKQISGTAEVSSNGWEHFESSLELKTPFDNMRDSKFTYEHTGDIKGNFQCNIDMTSSSKSLKGTLKASSAPWSVALDIQTPFEDYQRFGFNGYLSKKDSRYSSKFESTWHPAKSINVEGSFSTRKTQTEGTASISTPFEALRHASANFVHRPTSRNNIETLRVTYNNKPMIDMELDFDVSDVQKKVSLAVNAPRPMKFDLDGKITKSLSSIDAIANWNMDNDNCSAKINAVIDLRTAKDVSFDIIHPAQSVSFKGIVDSAHSKSELSWGSESSMQKAGYDVTFNKQDARLRLMLPSRTLELTGSHNDRITEGSFQWDADMDNTRKVGFRSVIVPRRDAVKVNLDLMLPSLGKNVQVGSEVVVNRGRVIFDGKAELSYSPDKRKTIVVSSRLEDISETASAKNYSFSLGLSHPYSTVGIKLDSHVGKSTGAYSAGMEVEYMTVRRQTKTFQVSGEIDKLRKAINFKLRSPMKSIHISGNAKTGKDFQVSLMNVYDERLPLFTTLIVKPEERSIHLSANYDLDNPQNTYHISAQYVNSSAIAAEMYGMVDSNKRTDALLTARLNNTHLFHSRAHWRTDMLEDLEAFTASRLEEYALRGAAASLDASEAVIGEWESKKQLIRQAAVEELGEDAVAKVESVIAVVLKKGEQLWIKTSEGIYNVSQPIIMNLANSTQRSYKFYTNKYNEIYNNVSLPSMDEFDTTMLQYAYNMVELPSKQVPPQIARALRVGVAMMTDEQDSYMIRQASEYLDLPAQGEAIVKEMLANMEHEIVLELGEVARLLKISPKAEFTVYDPAHGEVQMEVHLPLPLLTLDAMPVIDVAKYVDEIVNRLPSVDSLTPELPDFSGEWLPPFTGVATIEGGRRVTTFDGYVYDLNLDCTFVLTKDFADGNFSIIISNDEETTLSILTPGAAIEITQTGQILVGGKPAALPYRQHNVTITPLQDTVVEIRRGDNFRVVYDRSVDHITVEVSGWYFGRMGGLLGTFDNEPSNEMMTSYRKVNTNVKRFMKSWEVGKGAC